MIINIYIYVYDRTIWHDYEMTLIIGWFNPSENEKKEKIFGSIKHLYVFRCLL